MSQQTTLDDVKQKVDAMLSLATKSAYECWEDLQEDVMQEMTEEEQEEHCDDIGEIVEQWWNSTEDDGDEE
jgi:hypothetical protein